MKAMCLIFYRSNSGKYLIASLAVISMAFILSCKKSPEKMESPDQSISATISTNARHELQYNLTFHEKSVITSSLLGIVLNDDTLGKNVSFKLADKQIIDEEYKTRGFHNVAYNHAVEYTWEIYSKKIDWKLQVRLYNDGLAFRYLIPNKGKTLVNKELTNFSVPKNIPVWFFERPNDWKLKSYAGEWMQTSSDSLCKISPTGPVQGPVLVYELPENRYMAITEAALYNYSGMRLKAKKDASLQVNFTEHEGYDIEGNITTPWRVVLLADDLNELVNSDLITNLNPAPDTTLFRDQSWIKPGRSVWSWWSGGKAYMTIPYEKHIIDIAGELGYEYTLLDEGWEKWSDKWKQLGEICSFANEKQVGVLVWKHSNQLSNPENDYAIMRSFLDSVKNAGVAGVKIDFMNSETKKIIDFDIRALQLCAERHLLVDFHGCQKPSGESRTFPNEITREGIRGLELNRMKQPIPGNHNVALVFTRCILNNADYTPIGFSNPGSTSWVHQLATAYAFTSSLIVVAENPDILMDISVKTGILPFIKEIPSVWDETIILPQSSISEMAILARRKGNDWYLIALNGKSKKAVTVETDFLMKGNWKLFAAEDDPYNQKNIILRYLKISSGEPLTLSLNSEGGYLAKLTVTND